MKVMITMLFMLSTAVMIPFGSSGDAKKHFSVTSINDSLRTAELDQFWEELATTVRKGDIEAYASGYHEDAVVVFAGRTSIPIIDALKVWEKGFTDTKAGIVKSDVKFRFSERIGDASTAFETGMFNFSTVDNQGNVQNHYAHLQALLVKKDGVWCCLMEYQKAATEEDWNNMKDI